MKHLLFGDDTVAIRFRKQELIEAFAREHASGQVMTFAVGESQGAALEKLEEELLPALFEVPKILIVEGLGTVYEGNKERVEHLLATHTTSSVVIVEARKMPKTDPFLKYISKQSFDNTEEYPLKKRDLEKFIHLTQKKSGGQLDRRTLALIQERSGKDDELMLQNIQKVLTYAGGEPVSSEALDVLVPAPLEVKIFDALDALVSGQKEKALVLFRQLLSQEDIFRIFPLCAWQIRQMLLVAEAKDQVGENKEKIAKMASMHPFVVQKLLRVLPRYPRTRLARGLKILSELDVELKQSKKTPEGALQHFLFHW